MEEKNKYIRAVEEAVVAAIRRKTALSLPNDPSAAGMSAQTIRRRFWEAICGQKDSLLSELIRIVDEINEAMDSVLTDNEHFKQLTERAEEATNRINESVRADRLFFRYSAYPDGRDYTDRWERGLNYIGVAVGFYEPEDASGYQWSLFSPGVYVGSGDMPPYADVQIDPEESFTANFGIDSTAMTEAGHVSGYGSVVAPCSTNDVINPQSSGVMTDHVTMTQEIEGDRTVFRFYADTMFEAPMGVLLVFRYYPNNVEHYCYASIVLGGPREETVSLDDEGNEHYLLGSFLVPTKHTEIDEQYSRCYFAGTLTKDKITAAQAHGIGCVAAEMGAFAAGYLARAIGRQALAIGFDVEASAPSAVAIGYELIARSVQQTVLGRFNVVDADEKYAFMFGNGKDEDHRSNAIQMDWDGNIDFSGNVRSEALMPRDEYDLTSKHYVDWAVGAQGEVFILRTDEIDTNVQLGNAGTAWSTPAEYTTDFLAPFSGFGGAYVTDNSDFSNRWMLQVKLPEGIDVSGSHLIGIWLAVESTDTGTLSAAVQIEFTSTGNADNREKCFELKTSDGTLTAGAWRLYVLDLANGREMSPFIGYSKITNDEPDETAINYMRILGISVKHGRVLVGKCMLIPRRSNVLYNERGVFADSITVGGVTLQPSQITELLELIK